MDKLVLVTGSVLVPEEALALIRSAGFPIRRAPQDTFSDDELHEALAGVAGYVIGGDEKPSSEHFERAAALEAVAFTGSDYKSHVPGWRRAVERGISLAACPGANAVSVAESAVLQMLTMARPSVRVARPTDTPSTQPDIELRGRTLGLVGFGHVGSRVSAAAGQGLGMEVLYHARHRNPDTDVPFVSLEELLDRADVISLHRPGLAAGEPAFLGKTEFTLVRPGSILINTAHPSLVDPVALEWAITTKEVRAAVEGIELVSGWSGLAALGSDRFLGLPMVSHHTHEANLRIALQAAQAVCDALTRGRPEASGAL